MMEVRPQESCMRRMRSAVPASILMCVIAGSADASVRVGWQDQRAAILADEAPTAYAAAQFIGADEMRFIVLWHKVQPSPNEWRWGEVDAAVRRARGFNVQLVLGGVGARPPAWAGGGDYGTVGQGSYRYLDDRAFVRFVKAAARRYGHRVKLWSILNEVEISGYPAERYASLYKRSRRAIRRYAGRRGRVLWGEFSPHAPLQYTRDVLAASRGPVIADGFALHPYSGTHAAREGGLDNLGKAKRRVASWSRGKRRRLVTPGGSPLPIYGTEYGCQTRTNAEAECARQWHDGLEQAARHRLRQLVAYQMIPKYHLTWDTSLLRWDGSPSMAMWLIATWTRARR
jgi:hypothetical protein